MLSTQAGRLSHIDRGLIATAAIGGLLGGAALFLFMGGYYSANSVGFTSMLSFCFAGFVYKLSSASMGEMAGSPNMSHSGTPMAGSETTMAGAHTTMPMTGSETTMAGAHTTMPMAGNHATVASHGMGMMMGGSTPTSHLVVGSILHTAMSATAGVAFAIALAVLIRAGLGLLATPVGYVLGGAAGGALLYLIMVYAVSPSLNTNISDFTPRGPIFIAHLVFGATVAGFVYWRYHQTAAPSSTMLAAGVA
jgi:hypothetical protein